MTIGLLAVYGLVAVLGGSDLVAWASGRAAVAAGNVPSVMNYQGHLQDDSGVPLDGTYDITFRIYDSVSAPAALWTETHTDVTVREGYFSVLLGYSNPLPDSLFSTPDRYIGVTVAPYDEMTPRQRFASVPYAFHAWQTDRAFLADRAFGLSAPDENPRNAVVVDNDGKVGIGTLNPGSQLHVAGDYYGKGSVHLYAAEGEGASGTAVVLAYDPTTSSNIDLAFRTKQGTVGHEVVRLTSDGNVGVGTGTTTPDGKLHIVHEQQDANGNALVLGPNGESQLRLGYHADYGWVQSHGSKPLAINPLLNNVGIGTTAPTEKLDVNGNVQVSGDLNVNGDITNFSVEDYVLSVTYGGMNEITLKPKANSICFLRGISMGTGIGWGTDPTYCLVRQDDVGPNWLLSGWNMMFAQLDCSASCLSW